MFAEIIISLIKIVLVIIILLIGVAYSVYAERRLSAFIKNRLGPNRVGWEGVLQPFADVFKLVLKEDVVPEKATYAIHTLAPMIYSVLGGERVGGSPLNASAKWGPDYFCSANPQ